MEKKKGLKKSEPTEHGEGDWKKTKTGRNRKNAEKILTTRGDHHQKAWVGAAESTPSR